MRDENKFNYTKLPKIKTFTHKQDIQGILSILIFVIGLLNWLLSNY